MTVFHVMGYWYLAITLVGIAALLTYSLVEFVGRTNTGGKHDRIH